MEKSKENIIYIIDSSINDAYREITELLDKPMNEFEFAKLYVSEIIRMLAGSVEKTSQENK